MNEGSTRGRRAVAGARPGGGGALRSRSRRGRGPAPWRLAALALVCARRRLRRIARRDRLAARPRGDSRDGDDADRDRTGVGPRHRSEPVGRLRVRDEDEADLPSDPVLTTTRASASAAAPTGSCACSSTTPGRGSTSPPSATFTLTDGVKMKSIPAGRQARIVWDATRGASHVTWGVSGAYFTGRLVARPGSGFLQLVGANQNGTSGVHYRGALWVHHLDAGTRSSIACRSRAISTAWCRTSPRHGGRRGRSECRRWRRARTPSSRSTAGGLFDVYCTTRSQVYDGVDGRGGEQATTTAAVDATRGVVATYGGKVITAFFFSTSGGRTENIENVWTGTSPRALPQERPRSLRDPGCRRSHRLPLPRLAAAGALHRGAARRRARAERPGHHHRGDRARRLAARRDGTHRAGRQRPVYQRRHAALEAGPAFHLVRPAHRLHHPGGKHAADDRPWRQRDALGCRLPGSRCRGDGDLHYRAEGETVWQTTSVATTPGSTTVDGTVIDFPTWSFEASPTTTTTYYLSVGSAESPRTTVTVTP